MQTAGREGTRLEGWQEFLIAGEIDHLQLLLPPRGGGDLAAMFRVRKSRNDQAITQELADVTWSSRRTAAGGCGRVHL